MVLVQRRVLLEIASSAEICRFTSPDWGVRKQEYNSAEKMPLAAGTRLGPYEVLSPAGGRWDGGSVSRQRYPLGPCRCY